MAKSILDLIPKRNIVNDPNAFTTLELSKEKGISLSRMGAIIKNLVDSGKVEKVYVKRGTEIVPAYRIKGK